MESVLKKGIERHEAKQSKGSCGCADHVHKRYGPPKPKPLLLVVVPPLNLNRQPTHTPPPHQLTMPCLLLPQRPSNDQARLLQTGFGLPWPVAAVAGGDERGAASMPMVEGERSSGALTQRRSEVCQVAGCVAAMAGHGSNEHATAHQAHPKQYAHTQPSDWRPWSPS